MAKACAGWQAQRYGWTVDPSQIHPVADVLRGLEIVIRHFSPPGSAIVLPTPAYMPFLFVPHLMGREIIQVPMLRQDDRWVYDLEALDQAFAAGGGLLILCNPHNPLGRVMRHSELVAISEVVDRHNARVFSDEVHAPLVYEGHRHVPYASVSPLAAGHTVTATSASKAWNIPGLKCAQLIMSNDADTTTWHTIEGLEEYRYGASPLGAAANAAAYQSGGPWLDDIIGYLDENRRLLGSLLSKHLPGVGYTMPEGTYLGWLDFREAGFGDQPGSVIREHGGVALTDGAECGAAGTGFARINVATPKPILEEMITRIARVSKDL
nr:aminotransferase class I/II-fold pyridoxal phosphate-dependent enzyme [Phytoactinopolyspora mesophila]